MLSWTKFADCCKVQSAWLPWRDPNIPFVVNMPHLVVSRGLHIYIILASQNKRYVL